MAFLASATSWLALVASAHATPVFTGDAAADFAIPRAQYIPDLGGIDVGVPTRLGGVVSGHDVNGIHVFYDPRQDTLFVGIETFGIATDADGDGDPGNTSPPLLALGGTDAPDISNTEAFAVYLDLDLDGLPDVVAGVAALETSADFRVAAYAGLLITPGLSFGPSLDPMFQGVLHAPPSAATPHLEFTLPRVSELPTSSGSPVGATVGLGAFLGSLADAGIGEDYVPSIAAFAPVQLLTCGDGVQSAGETCDDGNALPDDGCDSTCQIEDGYTCECAFGEDLSIADTAAISLFGGLSTTSVGSGTCPDGEFLHGITGQRVADHIVSLDLVCGPASVDDTGLIVLSPQSAVPALLAPVVGERIYTRTCPTDQVVVGIAGHTSNDPIEGLELVCAPLHLDQGAIRTGTAERSGRPIGRTEASSERICPEHTSVVALSGWGIDGVSSLALTCAGATTACGELPDTCRPYAQCGDGRVEGPEFCDDGNTLDADGCDGDCRASICGDGLIGPDEDCDDGNLSNADDCTNVCTLPFCGDGILSPNLGEQCDDGNLDPTDACTPSCLPAACGDGIVQPPERCDDGNVFDGDSCNRLCVEPGCGNGVVEDDELCDDGNRVVGDACDNQCRPVAQCAQSSLAGWTVATYSARQGSADPWTVGLIQTRNPDLADDLSTPPRAHHPDWTAEVLGNVFGIAIDDLGAVYLTATSNRPGFLPDAIVGYGSLGGGTDDLGAAGTVYRLDPSTGLPSVFSQLPQQASLLDPGRTSGPGLGNIAWDGIGRQFFVTNMEDGRIYRLQADGQLLDSFDPLLADDGSAGFPPPEERAWGIAVQQDRVYYGIGSDPAEIRSVGLTADRGFTLGSDRAEFRVESELAGAPVSDIVFDERGHMVLAQRTMTSDTEVYAHNAGVLVHAFDGERWRVHNRWRVSPSSGVGQSAGGIDLDGTVLWASVGDLVDEVHGIIGVSMSSLPVEWDAPWSGWTAVAYEPSATDDPRGMGGDVEIFDRSGGACCTLDLRIASTPVTCDTQGSIDLDVLHPNGSVAVRWSDGVTTEDRRDLEPGTWRVTVTDAACSRERTVRVREGRRLPWGGWAAISKGTSPWYAPQEQWTLELVDLREPQLGVGISNPPRFQHPDWTAQQLGNVFGITSSDDGTLFVAATSNVATYLGSDVWRYGDLGGGADDLSAAGTVYRLDAEGAPVPFVVLPQQATALTSGGNNARTTGPGLGNLVHHHDQLYISNMEDGTLYRVGEHGDILGSFDPLDPDDGLPGFAPLGERIWGLDIWRGRLFYAVNRQGQDHVRSVALDHDGAFLPDTDLLEFVAQSPLDTMPVSDIAISEEGRIAIAHRTMQSDVVAYAHGGMVEIYEATPTGWEQTRAWNPSIYEQSGFESYGGLAWGPSEMLWASSADILDPNQTHGLVGRPFHAIPDDLSGGDPATAAVLMYDPLNTRDTKGVGGDVEIMPDHIFDDCSAD